MYDKAKASVMFGSNSNDFLAARDAILRLYIYLRKTLCHLSATCRIRFGT